MGETDYAPFVAAALNARHGTTYDVGKFLDFLFEGDSAFRSGWAVMTGEFDTTAVDGLVGQSGDYAFAMNSFHLASVLAPLVKYDERYATAIGKYLLNLVNNAQVFFPQNLPLGHQTMTGYLPFDTTGSICYEGFRNEYNGVRALAMGDATASFGQPSDLSVYSAAFIGALGGMAAETNVTGILEINLNVTDSFGENTFDHYLYYNPYTTEQTIRFTHEGAYDLFDAVTKRVVARNVSGTVNVAVPASSSCLLIVLPAESDIVREGDDLLVGDIVIARYRAAVNLIGLVSREELTEASIITISSYAPKGDEVVRMQIAFNEIQVYDGTPLTAFQYDKDLLPDTDYTMKITITTRDGRVDYVTKRVVCR